MKKIISYEETKKLLNKGLKMYRNAPERRGYIYLSKRGLDEAIVRKDIFDKLLQEKFIKLEKNDFDPFNFIEMYGVK